MNNFYEIKGGVTAPLGFDAAGVMAHIKEYPKRRPDLAVIYSREPNTISYGVFTKNIVKAAPVLWDQKVIQKGKSNLIIVNSGNANASTGKKGMENVEKIAQKASELWNVDKNSVLICSTGVIGVDLPVDKITSKLPYAKKRLGRDIKETSARAIMTTDTYKKTCAVSLDINGRNVTIGAIAKGSGMIHPDMATMLAFFTTDVNITREMLKLAFDRVIERSFNSITIDGDTSTNDTALILANGLAKNDLIDKEDEKFQKFYNALEYIAMDLAKKMAKDGEGATKFITIQVEGLDSYDNARKIAKKIAESNLVKTAFFGNDPNWGRILAAAGNAGVSFDPEKVEVILNSLPIVQDGVASEYLEEDAVKEMKKKEVTLIVNFHEGNEGATVWTCDFSYDYVTINASYRT